MNDTEKIGLLLGLLMLVLIGLALAGCQAVHGLALDIESSARYVADHTTVDR